MSKKITISRRAAEGRVRRVLVKEVLAFRKARGRYIDELGEYLVVDIYMNVVMDRGCTLEQLVADNNVLRQWRRCRNCHPGLPKTRSGGLLNVCGCKVTQRTIGHKKRAANSRNPLIYLVELSGIERGRLRSLTRSAVRQAS